MALWHSTALALVALAAGASGGWTARGWLADRNASQHAAAVSTARETAMHEALIETDRRLRAQQEAADVADQNARRARAAALAAGADVDRLRQRAADLADAARCDSAAPAVGQAASAAAVLLADVLGRVAARSGELAAEADRRGTAGSECAARYDALTR